MTAFVEKEHSMSASAPGSGDRDSRTRVISYIPVETGLDQGIFLISFRSKPFVNRAVNRLSALS